MLREADREDQLAEFRLQQKKTTAQSTPPSSSPGVFASNPAVAASTQTKAPDPTDATAVNAGAQSTTATTAQPAAPISATQATAKTQAAPSEELPAFVPAPKSLVSSTAANEVAAVNTNLAGDARATLTSLTKPIETVMSPISSRGSSAQLSLTPVDQTMRVRESRRFALELKSDVSLALAIIALRFDPKVVKVTAVTAADANGNAPSFTQSTDASGVCLISFANVKGTAATKTTLVYVDVEGIAPGDASLLLDKDSMHLVGVDARDLTVDVTPARATVKQ
jgi:hypothetical protein